MPIDYAAKFRELTSDALWSRLDSASRGAIRRMAFLYHLTCQDYRTLVTAARDLAMWDEQPLALWWESYAGEGEPGTGEPADKKRFLRDFRQWFSGVRDAEKVYPAGGLPHPRRRSTKIERKSTDKAIHGLCPVASQETLCCRLRTIDAVESCPFGCSYCSIQTFYGDRAVFDRDFAAKLGAIEVDPSRFARYSTGQASDSLVWGNRFDTLTHLLAFAGSHPNILLELKSKSDRVGCLLRRSCPPNVVCSWSLNPPTIIRSEEHFTPSLEKRLRAARLVADRGIKVAFHFHPMIRYHGWRWEYESVGRRVMELFTPEEVLFISFGSVTLIKPVIRALRLAGQKTKILQMPLSPDPKGKLTYPDDIKIALFRHMRRVFGDYPVYFYLCMEKRSIWEGTFGFAYGSNEEFEQDFGRNTMGKLRERGRLK